MCYFLVNCEFMAKGRVYTVSLQTLGLPVNSMFPFMWREQLYHRYSWSYEGLLSDAFIMCPTFSLLCSVISMHYISASASCVPSHGWGKESKSQNSVLTHLFLLALYIYKKCLVHPDWFHGEIEICERKTDPEYFMETFFFIFKSCLKLSFLLLPIATQKSENNLGDRTF